MKERASKWAEQHDYEHISYLWEALKCHVEMAFMAGYQVERRDEQWERLGKTFKRIRQRNVSDSRQDYNKSVKDESLGVKPPICPKKHLRTVWTPKQMQKREEHVTK